MRANEEVIKKLIRGIDKRKLMIKVTMYGEDVSLAWNGVREVVFNNVYRGVKRAIIDYIDNNVIRSSINGYNGQLTRPEGFTRKKLEGAWKLL